MKKITTMEQPTTTLSVRKILSNNGFECAVVTLQPDDDMAIDAARDSEERLLYVISGEATASSGEITTLLSAESAFLVPQREGCRVTVSGTQPVKLLRVEVPSRQVIEPPIYAFEAAESAK